MQRSSPLREKSILLGIEALKLNTYLKTAACPFSVINQFVKSATAPGALIAEAADCESRADMKHKLGIALKEARETEYWLKLISGLNGINSQELNTVSDLLNQVISMLVASQKTLKSKLQ